MGGCEPQAGTSRPSGGETILGWGFGRSSEAHALSLLNSSSPRGGTVTEAFPYGAVGGKASACHCLRWIPKPCWAPAVTRGWWPCGWHPGTMLAAWWTTRSPDPASPQPGEHSKHMLQGPRLQTPISRHFDTPFNFPDRFAKPLHFQRLCVSISSPNMLPITMQNNHINFHLR